MGKSKRFHKRVQKRHTRNHKPTRKKNKMNKNYSRKQRGGNPVVGITIGAVVAVAAAAALAYKTRRVPTLLEKAIRKVESAAKKLEKSRAYSSAYNERHKDSDTSVLWTGFVPRTDKPGISKTKAQARNIEWLKTAYKLSVLAAEQELASAQKELAEIKSDVSSSAFSPAAATAIGPIFLEPVEGDVYDVPL